MLAIYTGLTPEIAALEIAALEKVGTYGEILPADWVLVQIELPDGETFMKLLPPHCFLRVGDELPSSIAAAAFGCTFLNRG